MERLDVAHHKIIMLCIILIVFVSGIFLGVKIASITGGGEAMIVILFALSFLSLMMLFLIFIQLVHIQDDMKRFVPSKVKRRKK